MSRSIIVLLIIVRFCSFCDIPEPKSKLIKINIEENVNNCKLLKITDLCGDLQYIPINVDSINLRSFIICDFSKDFIVVSDRSTCLLINSSGDFVAKIGSLGKGPGEYPIIGDVKFGLGRQVIIFDYNSFLVYDFEGTFITKFDLEVNVNSVMDGNLSSWLPFNDSLFIGQVSNYSGQGKHKAVFFDNRGKTIKLVPNYSVLSLPKGYSDSNKSLAFIYKHGGNTFFKEYYDDTLFIINDQYLMDPVCFFFLGKYGMPSSFRELPRQEFLKVKQNYISIKNIFETSSYIFLNCLFRNHTPAKRSEALIYPNIDGSPLESWYYPVSMLGVYQKLTKEMRFAKPLKSDNEMINDGLHNDFDGGVNFYPTKMVNDSTLAMWVDAYKLKEHVASIEFKNSMPKYQEKKRELELFVNQLDVNDNPVLILCTFK